MMRRSVVIALTIGLTLIGVAVIVVPMHAPLAVAGSNSIHGENYLELEERGALSSCQPAGTLPQGTSAIRIGVEGLYFSPATTLKVLSGSRVLREGHHGAGGPSAPNVTVPVERLAHTVDGARICTTVGPAVGPIRYYGTPRHSSTPSANPLQEATLRVEYLRPGVKSWWSFASSIAHHMGLGRAPGGTWIAFLAMALMLAVIVGAARLTLEELR
jgi:hypothetical protein